MGIGRNTERPRAHDSDITALLDADQVGKLLGLSAVTVRKYARAGVLPGHRLPGGFSAPWRFSEGEVQSAWRRHLLKQEVAEVMEAKAREEIKERSRKLFDAGKGEELKALVTSFGATGISTLPADLLATFRAHLLRLGHHK